MRGIYLAVVIATTAGLQFPAVAAAGPPRVEPFLLAGDLAGGERELTLHLAAHPTDDEARFGLGTLQFLRAIENLGQQLHRFGALPQQNSVLLGRGAAVPIFRLPVPENADPKEITYKDARRILRNLLADLSKADKTLKAVTDANVKLPLRFGLIRLDLDGDGKSLEPERLWRLYASLMNTRASLVSREFVQKFTIVFDKADVHWMRGYCHLISALAEMALAYDWEELFSKTGHMLFAKVDLFAEADPSIEVPSGNFEFIGRALDEIAMVHLVQLKVKRPARMRKALQHLKVVIQQSRLTWQAIAAETDDEREWIPGPHQTGVVQGVRVNSEMVAAWKEFINEAEAILDGEKLVPFWRGNDQGYGVNLNRVFTKPRDFDLVLWLQGNAAIPYLEKGQVSSPEVWRRLQRIFRGEFIGFAIWFN